MKNSNKIGSRKGFSLVEIILAALILGLFINSALMMTSQLLTTRSDGNFETSKQQWAKLEGRLAVEGVIGASAALSDLKLNPVDELKQNSSLYFTAITTADTDNAVQSGGSLSVIPVTYDSCLTKIDIDHDSHLKPAMRKQLGMSLNNAVANATPPKNDLKIDYNLHVGGSSLSFNSYSNQSNTSTITLDLNSSDVDWNGPNGAPQIKATATEISSAPESAYSIRFSFSNPLPGSGDDLMLDGIDTNILTDSLQGSGATSDIEEPIILYCRAVSNNGSYKSSDVIQLTLNLKKIVPQIQISREDGSSNTNVAITDVAWSIDVSNDSVEPGSDEEKELNELQNALENMKSNDFNTKVVDDNGDALPDYFASTNQYKIDYSLAGEKIDADNIYTKEADSDPSSEFIKMAWDDFSTESEAFQANFESNNFLLAQVDPKIEYLGVTPKIVPLVEFSPGTGTVFDSVQEITLKGIGIDTDDFWSKVQNDKFYYIEYSIDEASYERYKDPFTIGNDFTSGQETVITARSSKTRNVGPFLLEYDPRLARYQKEQSDGDNGWRWNVAGEDNSDNQTFTWWRSNNWTEPDQIPGSFDLDFESSNTYNSWNNNRSNKWNTNYKDTMDMHSGMVDALLFGSIIKSDTTININSSETFALPKNSITIYMEDYYPHLNKITFNSENSYTINGSGNITMNTYGSETAIVVDKGDHTINADLKIERSTKINTITGSELDITTANLTSQYFTEGITKIGKGTLNLQDHSDYVGVDLLLKEGELKLGGANRFNPENAITLDGGIFNLQEHDQELESFLDITSSSIIDFGVTNGTASNYSVLQFSEMYIESDSLLTIKNWQEPSIDSSGNISNGDFFITEVYPGDRILKRIQFEGKTLQGAKWIPQTIDGKSVGILMPATTPKSPGIANLNVTETSQIYFEGTSQLTVESIYILDGAILEIHNFNWESSTTANIDQFIITNPISNDVLERIKFDEPDGKSSDYHAIIHDEVYIKPDYNKPFNN